MFSTRHISPSSSHRIRPRCSFRSRTQLSRSHLILTHRRALLSLSMPLGPTAAMVLLRLSSRYPVKSRRQLTSASSTSSAFLARPRWHQRPPATTVHIRYLCIYRMKLFVMVLPIPTYTTTYLVTQSHIQSAFNHWHQHPSTCNSISVSNAAHAVIIHLSSPFHSNTRNSALSKMHSIHSRPYPRLRQHVIIISSLSPT